LPAASDDDSPKISRQIHLARKPFVGIAQLADRFDRFPASHTFVISVLFTAQRAPGNNDRPATIHPDLPPPTRQTHDNPSRTAAGLPPLARLQSWRNQGKPRSSGHNAFDSSDPLSFRCGAKVTWKAFFDHVL
jgi:hypothetical protein